MASWPGGNGVRVDTAGTGYTWVAPAGVTKVTVDLWGAGGGGDGGFFSHGLGEDDGGSGGGGGGYSQTIFTNIVPGNTYSITLGAKGTAGAASGGAGGTGADSSTSGFSSSVIAKGGTGGGAGGVLGTGTIKHSGGSGGLSDGTDGGWGGGGSAGNGSNGGAGSQGTTGSGGSAGTGTPPGHAGANATSGVGGTGASPGAGGAGGRGSSSFAGGAGAPGSGTLTWPTVFTITFNANSGSGSMSAEQNNQAAALTSNAYTRTGYTFNNWNTVAGGGGTTYADGASYAFTASTTLYAQWTINSYDVIFNANGGTGTMANETQDYNTTAALTTNTFTRGGYTFTGWNTAADGSGTAYADGASFTWPASNTTLYAQWTLANTMGILAVM